MKLPPDKVDTKLKKHPSAAREIFVEPGQIPRHVVSCNWPTLSGLLLFTKDNTSFSSWPNSADSVERKSGDHV